MFIKTYGNPNRRIYKKIKEIIKLCGQLQQFKTHKAIPTKEKKLKLHLETFNREILLKKKQKFMQDKNAFETGKAYKWNQLKPQGKFKHSNTSEFQTTCYAPQSHKSLKT